MIDTIGLKAQIDLRILANQYTHFVTRESAKEQKGPCPKCGGKDRFYVQHQFFACRQCHPTRGDAIAFVQWLQDCDFKKAIEVLGGDVTLKSMIREVEEKPLSVEVEPPNSRWQNAARSLAEWAEEQLWSDPDEVGLIFLRKRGFTDVTILEAQLGYNSYEGWRKKKKWGTEKDVYLHSGISIPWLQGDQIWRLNIRLIETRSDQDGQPIRYRGPGGWAGGSPLYSLYPIETSKPVVLVESEFDALTIHQSCDDLVLPVATGSTCGGRRKPWLAKLAMTPLVLIAYDNDSAGEKAAQFWQQMLPNTKRWRPYWDDASQMAQDGGDIRQWIMAAGVQSKDFNHP
ncbi:MAG: toprim domain-containing protein [Chloroflexota bacterium]